MELIFIALGAGLIYYLQGLLYKKFWDKGLKAEVKFKEEILIEKETGHLKEIIFNRKLLPLPMLKVKFEVNKNLLFDTEVNVSVSDRCYKNDIFSVMLYQKITRTLAFTAAKRGYYPIEQIDFISSDLFMNLPLVKTVPCHTVLTVCPGFVDASRILVPYQKAMGSVMSRKNLYQDPFEFRSIRPYEPFDRMKDINWKASAKTGELKVNVHNDTSRQEICMILNLDSDSIFEREQLIEESIRIVHTLAELFLSQGICVSLYGNGTDIVTKEALNIPSGSGSNHFTSIQHRLARLDFSKEHIEGEALLEERAQKSDQDVIYVLVSTAHRKSIQHRYQELCQKSGGSGSLWIMPLHPDMEAQVNECSCADVLKWEVENV